MVWQVSSQDRPGGCGGTRVRFFYGGAVAQRVSFSQRHSVNISGVVSATRRYRSWFQWELWRRWKRKGQDCKTEARQTFGCWKTGQDWGVQSLWGQGWQNDTRLRFEWEESGSYTAQTDIYEQGLAGQQQPQQWRQKLWLWSIRSASEHSRQWSFREASLNFCFCLNITQWN